MPAHAPAALPVSRSGPRLPQPEKFCGSHDARRVENFLDEAFLWLLTANITVAHRAIWGSFLLTGDAKPFLTSKLADLHTRTGVTLPTMTWDQFRSIMIEGCCKPELNISARAALHALRQDRLSVPDLARELRRLVSKIHPAVDVPEQIFVFLTALRPSLRRSCGSHPS